MSHYSKSDIEFQNIFHITHIGQDRKFHARGFTLLHHTCPNAYVIFLK